MDEQLKFRFEELEEEAKRLAFELLKLQVRINILRQQLEEQGQAVDSAPYSR